MKGYIKLVSVLIMVIAFTTVAAAGPPTITNIANTTPTHNSVTIAWDTTDEASDSLVRYTNASGTYEHYKSAEGFSHTVPLTGLSPATAYTCVVNSTNSTSGNSSETAGPSFTTLSAPDTTPPVITNVVNTTTSNSATITWTTDEDSNSLVKYDTDSGTPYAHNKSSGDLEKSHSIELTDLEADTPYYFRVNSTDEYNNSNESGEYSFTTLSAPDTTPPVITNVVNTTTSNSATITWTTDEDSNSLVKYDTDSGTPYAHNKSSGDLEKSHSIELTDLEADTPYYFRVNSTDEHDNSNESGEYVLKTQSSGYTTGNRIWEEDTCGDPYTWTAQSFTGFYYDIDDGLSTETLTITGIKQTLEGGAIEYVTETRLVKFDYSGWGEYNVIGFMAEKYFAGYDKDKTKKITDETISLVSNKMLSKVLIDEDDKHMVSTGASLKLKEDYELKIIQLDVGGDKAQIELLRNGKSVDTGIIDKTPATYVYTRDIGKVDDVPLLAVNVDSVFAGTESDMLVIKGIFQISEDYKSVKTGDNYGEMEIKSTSSGGITMKNDDDISLDEGEIVDLMGNIKFLVADDPSTLRFALYEEITEPGTYDIRGTVYNITDKPAWTPMNFEGFYYDIDEPLGTEQLKVEDADTSIGAGNLVYTTTVESVTFDYSGWGKYDVIGFMAEQYFAGYDKTKTEKITDETISLVSNKMLSKVLIDEDDKYMVSTGASLELKEDYELKIIQLDVGGDKAQIELLRKGKSVDTGIIDKTPATYVYTRDIGKVEDVPLLAINVDSVFAGTESDMLVIKGIFQISEDYKSVKTGDNYGEMDIKSTSSSGITMKNDDDIDLDEGGTTMIMGDVGFMTSEYGERYCLFVRRTIGALDALAIGLPDNPVVDEELVITVTSGGDPVEGADVTFGGENLGITDSNGEIRFTPDAAGTFAVTASKENYDSASEDIQILTEDEGELDALDIAMPELVDPGEEVIIRVTSDGDAVEGATITWDGEEIGETDDTGSLTYAHDETGTYTVTASKSGYLDASEKITVSIPAAKFELDGISLPDEVAVKKSFTITTNVTNVGDIEGTYRAELVIDDGNGTVTTAGSENVTLMAGETGTVQFTYKIAKAGTYTVQIGGESGEIVVTPSKSKTALVAAILIVLALLGGIGYVLISSAPEGGWTAEKLIEAIKEKIPGKKGL